MSVDIRPVSDRTDLRAFVAFPLKLYRDSSCFVPNLTSDELRTLDRKQNPANAFCRAQLWLAYRDEKVVGRVAGIINDRYVEQWGSRHARFGWIDFIDDTEVADALIATCERWAIENGMSALHGPLGFTDLDPEGLLVEGFEELGTLPMIYNYPYYAVHLERLGYRKDVDWLEYSVNIPETLPEKITRVAARVQERTNLRIVRCSRRRELLRYAHDMFRVLNQAYAPLYAVTQLDERQIDGYVKQYFGFIHKDFVKVVVDSDDQVVAFAIAMPSLSNAMRKAWGRVLPFGFIHLLRALRHPEAIDLYLVAVRPDYQGRGVNSILFTEMHRACRTHGTIRAEASAQLESNRMVQAFWRYFDFRQHKRRRVYIKSLEGAGST